MPKIYESNILSNLGDMSGPHKLLYLALWEKANPIGIVEVNLAELGALAGDCRFHKSDLTALGNRIVQLDGGSRILIPTYLVTTVGRLSQSSRGQKRVFELIAKEWPGSSKENLGPFYDAWRAMGIEKIAPLTVDIYQGENMPLPKHVVDHRADVETARNVIKSGFSDSEIQNHFDDFCEVMYHHSIKQVTLSNCAKYRWNSGILLDNERAIQEAINNKKSSEKIIQAIRKAKNGLYPTILI